jgi:hypothetical protein
MAHKMKTPQEYAELLRDNVHCATQIDAALPNEQDWVRNAESLFALAMSDGFDSLCNKVAREIPSCWGLLERAIRSQLAF